MGDPGGDPGRRQEARQNIERSFLGVERQDVPRMFLQFCQQAVQTGDIDTAELLLSKYGRDTLAGLIGRKQADEQWDGLRRRRLRWWQGTRPAPWPKR